MKLKPSIFTIVLLSTLPAISHAANPTPVFDKNAALKIQNQRDLQISADALKKFDLNRARIIKGFGFKDGKICAVPPPIAETDIDMHRSLMVHDAATLSAGNFSFRRTLQKIADDVLLKAPGTTPETIFRQFWDTQNDTAHQVTAGNPHCDDNNGKVNGFPLNICPRPEGIEATGGNADITNRINNDYKPLALVNRLDLASQGWRNCGEHRIIYGKQGDVKNLIIFEAVLPNPKPGCRSGCRDVIEFWVDLSSDVNPVTRAAKLENFFYNGLPGFRPVVNSSHYDASGVSSVYGGSGSGQIRTNQFLRNPPVTGGTLIWTLKEFKTLLSCSGGACDYDIFPISVKANPYGPLWNKDVAGGGAPTPPSNNPFATPVPGLAALAVNFQADVLTQVTPDKLAAPNIDLLTYEVDPDKNAAESQSQNPNPVDQYRTQMNSASDASFRNNLNVLAAAHGLNADQIVNRATALSCAGCHRPPEFGLTSPNSIGAGMSWPNALTFVHVDTLPMVSLAGMPDFNAANFGGNSQGFNISPALQNNFLPARRTNLVNLANDKVCNCVRKPGLRPFPRPIGLKFNRIIAESDQKLTKELALVEKNFSKLKPRPTAADQKALLKQKRAVIAREEKRQTAAMQKAGVKFATPSLKPSGVVVAGKKLSGKQLKAAKENKLKAILKAEPPRKTINGTFRTH
ncbi:MAG: hypothetical protein OEZ39_19945 [Gammaproteobacteria bacterium]|nr:hypothetical protein [Gammaproteobacteria bacterium]MDH5654141.1 hypothetical protein [Gammaproteobacteria bacterium]